MPKYFWLFYVLGVKMGRNKIEDWIVESIEIFLICDFLEKML